MGGDWRGQQQEDYPNNGAKGHSCVLTYDCYGDQNQATADRACLGRGMHARIEVRQANHANCRQQAECRAQNQQRASQILFEACQHQLSSPGTMALRPPRSRM
jgi:hypothetical protein